MRKNPPLLAVLFSPFLLVLFSTNVFSQGYESKTIDGIWMGPLVLPNGVELRMGITVSDDTIASLNIIDQATGEIPIDDVVYTGDSVSFMLNRLGINIVGAIDFDQGTITSEFKQRGGAFPIVFNSVDKLPKLNRPQEPKGPFPYKSEDVIYENTDAGINLAGTLTFPKSEDPVPAVILLTGSGQQGRDQDIGGHKHFWVIADYLTRNGIAVLRVDDRGYGGSTGNFKQSTTGDFAKDAIAGIKYLQERNEIDSKKIGLLGHSEGGSIAAIAATNYDVVAYMVYLAGPGINFEDVVLSQIDERLKMQGVSEEDRELNKEWRKKLYAIAKEPIDSTTVTKKMWDAHAELSEEEVQRLNWPAGRQEQMISQLLNPWWRYYLALDNRSLLMNVDCPVLALYGGNDKQVTAVENSAVVEDALKEGGNKNYSIKIIPGLNHLFQTAETGSEYEYVQIEETISPDVLLLISNWIQQITED
jgi:pimeloyl-ACP methyl ester carboxylesterase